MAGPATITLAVKTAFTAATDERTRKIIGVVVGAILTPLILIVVFLLCLLSATSEHNNSIIEWCFNEKGVSASVPDEFSSHITHMKSSFAFLDDAVDEIEPLIEEGPLDNIRIKAVFFALFFSDENRISSVYEAQIFVNCFVSFEERIRKVYAKISGETTEESYTIAKPISLEAAYDNLSIAGMNANDADKTNAQKIYDRIVNGGSVIYGGDIEYGGTSSSPLDASAFTDPTTKNNLDLVAYTIQAFESNWGYVWGTYGDVLTESLFNYKLEQYPEGVGGYEDFIRTHWLGRKTTDCAGLIKGYGWLNPDTMEYEYASNGMPDVGADSLYRCATVSGAIVTMPDLPGLAVWKSGHIGVYIGNGEVIEAMGTKYGVVKTPLSERSWTAWLEIPYVTYITN